MALSPQQMAEKWARNAGAAGQSYTQGIDAVTSSPAERAIAQRNQYLQGVQASVDKWEAGLRRVSLEEWKRKAREKGSARYTSGVQGARGDYQSFAEEFAPHIQQVQSELQSMPRGDLQTNIQRAIHVMNRNAEFRRRR